MSDDPLRKKVIDEYDAGGDPIASGSLGRLLIQWGMGMAPRLGLRQGDVEDAAQEALISIFEKREELKKRQERFTGGGEGLCWFARAVLNNKCKEEFRKGSRQGQLPGKSDSDDPDSFSDMDDVADIAKSPERNVMDAQQIRVDYNSWDEELGRSIVEAGEAVGDVLLSLRLYLRFTCLDETADPQLEKFCIRVYRLASLPRPPSWSQHAEALVDSYPLKLDIPQALPPHFVLASLSPGGSQYQLDKPIVNFLQRAICGGMSTDGQAMVGARLRRSGVFALDEIRATLESRAAGDLFQVKEWANYRRRGREGD